MASSAEAPVGALRKRADSLTCPVSPTRTRAASLSGARASDSLVCSPAGALLAAKSFIL